MAMLMTQSLDHTPNLYCCIAKSLEGVLLFMGVQKPIIAGNTAAHHVTQFMTEFTCQC